MGGTIFGFYGEDTAVMRGDIELMGDPPVPPTRETLIAFSKTITAQSATFCSEITFSSTYADVCTEFALLRMISHICFCDRYGSDYSLGLQTVVHKVICYLHITPGKYL